MSEKTYHISVSNDVSSPDSLTVKMVKYIRESMAIMYKVVCRSSTDFRAYQQNELISELLLEKIQ